MGKPQEKDPLDIRNHPGLRRVRSNDDDPQASADAMRAQHATNEAAAEKTNQPAAPAQSQEPAMSEPKAEKKNADGNVTPLRPAKDADRHRIVVAQPGHGRRHHRRALPLCPRRQAEGLFPHRDRSGYRRRTEIYVHKIEGVIEREHLHHRPGDAQPIDEAQPCMLVTVDLSRRLAAAVADQAPQGGRARQRRLVDRAPAAARPGWIAGSSSSGGRARYKTRDAQPGYAPDPDFPSFRRSTSSCGWRSARHGIIRDKDHPIYRELFGCAGQGARTMTAV